MLLCISSLASKRVKKKNLKQSLSIFDTQITHYRISLAQFQYFIVIFLGKSIVPAESALVEDMPISLAKSGTQ